MTRTKRGPMSQKDIEYIQTNPKNLTVEQLAKKLKRNPSSIQKFLDDAKEEEEKMNQESLEQRKKRPQSRKRSFAQQLMGTVKHKNKPDKPIGSVMTPAASEYADGVRKKNKPSKWEADGVTKIYDD